MSKLKITLVSFLLTALCSISLAQSNVKLKDTDTIGVAVKDLRLANNKFVELDECKEMCDTLSKQVKLCLDLVGVQKEIVEKQKSVIKNQEIIIDDKTKGADLREQQYEKEVRKNRWLKIQRTALGITTLVLGITVLIMYK